jgi:Ti-type conjugative transfer relaxase TraA
MIAKAHTKKSGRDLANYLMRKKEGESTHLFELRGFASDDIREAFQSIDVTALATKGEKPMFHVSVRNAPGETLTDEQWLEVADRIEAKLGFTGQKRGVVFHINDKTGDRHMHVGWSRVDEETMTLICPAFYKLRLMEVCRTMEKKLGLTILDNERKGPRMAPTDAEFRQAKRRGVALEAVRATICDCWERSDNGRSFQAALEDNGLILSRGDKRAFVVVDENGSVQALGQRLLGVRVSELKDRCADLDHKALPTVEQARDQLRTGMVDQHAASMAWEDKLAAAAISQEKKIGRFAEPFSREQYDALAPAALADITRHQATFTRRDIEYTLKSGVENGAVRRAMADEILRNQDVVKLKAKNDKSERYTTQTVLEAERHVLATADALLLHGSHAVPSRLIDEKARGFSDEKARALAHICGDLAITILHGQAGTGKSTALAAGKECYESNGYRVVGLAHQNQVVEDLQGKGFTYARTIDRELGLLANGRTSWNTHTVVMVDEAAMVDTRRLSMILAYAHAHGAKVVLAGDEQQLSSIERGGMFELLKERCGAMVMREVHRQKALDDREASRLMADGQFAEALQIYDTKKAIHWHGQESDAAEALVAKYMKDRTAHPEKTRFIFAYTNKEVNQINAVVREARKSSGELTDGQTFETKHGKAEFAVGDRLQFTATDHMRGIVNGYAGAVTEIRGSQICVELDGRNKGNLTFDASEFQGFRHGYAGTIYSGQGRTIDQTYLFHSEYWRRSSSYVALTRHSEKTDLFVARETAADLPELVRQLARLDERRAATFFCEPPAKGFVKPIAPDRLAHWYRNLENVSRAARLCREENSRSDEGLPRETIVGRIGATDAREWGGIRKAFDALARRERERDNPDYSNAHHVLASQRSRWRLGRGGRQR